MTRSVYSSRNIPVMMSQQHHIDAGDADFGEPVENGAGTCFDKKTEVTVLKKIDIAERVSEKEDTGMNLRPLIHLSFSPRNPSITP